MGYKRLTINDIAKIANVSKSTVSRVVSNNGLVNKKTRENILKVIGKYKYKPSFGAQSLKTKKTKTIGLTIGDIENPYYSRVAKGVIETAQLYDYSIIIMNDNYDKKREEANLVKLIHRGVDGLILLTIGLTDKIKKKILKEKIPFFFLDIRVDEPGINYITNDHYAGAILACDYLIGLGHTRIVFLGSKNIYSLNERLKGYKSSLKKNGKKIVKDLVIDNIKEMENVYSVVCKIIKEKLDYSAIFCGNDFMAIQAMAAAYDNGIKIPDDISIVGYDNIKMSSITRAPLTTVRQYKYSLGSIAVKQLLNMIAEKRVEFGTTRIILKPSLVIRKSCKKII